MKYCPRCHSIPGITADPLRTCENCGWRGDYTKLLDGTPLGDCKQDENLGLKSPPFGHSLPVREARYLTHCTNIAHIIAHGQSQAIITSRVRMYLKITEKGEKV